MADFSLMRGGIESEAAGQDTANSDLTTITSGGSADTFGSWVQLIASTAANTTGLLLVFDSDTTGHKEIVVNIGVGAAASEEIVVGSAQTQIKGNAPCAYLYLPVRIPEGSRVSAQVATDGGSDTVGVGIHLFKGSFKDPVGVSGSQAYGISATEASEGTTIDTGATANTKGAWAELESSTSDNISGFYLCFGKGDDTTHQNNPFLIDIGIGGAGSEEIILSNLALREASSEATRQPVFVPIGIPSGTRVAARAQSPTTTAADRVFTLCLQGIK